MEAALAKRCIIGNIVSGWAMMSLGAVFFGLVTILSNWMTAGVYHLGGGPLSEFLRRSEK